MPAHRVSATWVGLGEASRLLGVSPGTLRRWADAGRIPVFVTIGGHRRFSRDSLGALLPARPDRRPPMARLGASLERMVRAYRVRGRVGRSPGPRWIARLPAEARDDLRWRGRELVRLLLAHLDGTDTDAAGSLKEATRLAAAYGRESAAMGMSLSETVERFLWYRAPFFDELARLARSRGLDAREATALLAAAGRATDHLLLGLMGGHRLEAAGNRETK
jgi:excisionase family DNA binding protein